jgi:hypothetical protein
MQEKQPEKPRDVKATQFSERADQHIGGPRPASHYPVYQPAKQEKKTPPPTSPPPKKE